MQLARRAGPITEADAFVIGDTPHDIDCANAIGVRTIAVATGGYSLDELSAHRPWRLFDELPRAEDFVRLIETAPRSPVAPASV
jgi:phosphoglycolate phosphatase-like HAD superfamily hydrolase